MARAGPKKKPQYGVEFKRAAVQLSHRPGIQVKAVAEALDIHPFMLSRWGKSFGKDDSGHGPLSRSGEPVKLRPNGRSGGCRSWNASTDCCRRNMPS